MNFLAPLFLLGGLAVALPILFHLIRRSSREKVLFSSLMFLRPTPPRLTRRNRLEHLLLLLLRCLAIGLLAAGFARPFLQKPMAAAPQDGAAAKTVLLVDISASMKRDGQWSAALAKAGAVLKAALPADQVALVAFDEQTRPLIGLEQWTAMVPAERASLAIQRLAASGPTWRSTHLGNALIAAAEMLEVADPARRNEPPAGPKRIVLISDLQEGSRLDGLQGYEWPRGIELVVETIKARRPTNAGLQWVMDAEDHPAAPSEAAFRLRVSNSADAQRDQFQIRWDGVPDAPPVQAYVPPGQSRIVSAPPPPADAAGARAVLSGDDDDFDNVVHVVQPRAEVIAVLFAGNDAETDPARLLYYLQRAFQDTRRQTVRITRLAPAGDALFSEAESSAVLSGGRLLIASTPLPDGQLAAARRFVTEGGTVLLVLNDAESARALSQLADAPGVEVKEAVVGNYAMLGQVDFEHPLLAPFADPRFSDFSKIRFWKHRRLALERLPEARVVARFDHGDPAIVEIQAGRGRLFVFTFSWRPADSQFALSSKFVPLLYSLLEQAGGLKAQLAQFRVGDTVNVSSIGAKPGHTGLTVRTPDGSPVRLAAGETRFSQTGQPGIYEVLLPGTTERFAVNLDAAESRTAAMPADELERLGLPMKAREISSVRQAEQTRLVHHAELESRQKFWRWLIVAALAVLLLETWLAGWITRRSAARTEVTA